MAKYLIQAYSRDMREILFQDDVEYDLVDNALLETCSLAYHDRIICLWIRSEKDPTRLCLIAKFY